MFERRFPTVYGFTLRLGIAASTEVFPDIFNCEFAKIVSYHEYFFQTILTCLSEMIMLGIAQEKFYNHTAVFTTSLAKLGELLFYTIIFFSETSLFISFNFRFS